MFKVTWYDRSYMKYCKHCESKNISDKPTSVNSKSEKVSFCPSNTFYCFVFEKNELRTDSSTDLTWRGFVMTRERERVKLCVTLYSIVTLQPPVEAATHLTLLLPPHYPWKAKVNYLKVSCVKLWISWRSVWTRDGTTPRREKKGQSGFRQQKSWDWLDQVKTATRTLFYLRDPE